MSNWRALSPGFDRMPARAGVYVVMANDSSYDCKPQAIYVGSTSNFRQRCGGHGFRVHGDGVRTPWGVFADVVLKFKPESCYRYRERRLIRKLRPPFNQVGLFRRGNNPQRVRTLDMDIALGF